RTVRYAHFRPFGAAVPYVLADREHLRSAWVDHALPGAVIQYKGFFAGAAVDLGPAARSAARAALLDLVAPPGARFAGQRRYGLFVRRHHAVPGELHVTLRRRADPRSGRILDHAVFAPGLECIPKRVNRGDRRAEQEEPKSGAIVARHVRMQLRL